MPGNALVAHEKRQFDPAWSFEAYKARNPRMNHYNGPVLRSVWADAVRWVIEAQMEWDSLDPAQQIAELRLEHRSIFWPLIYDSRVIVADCPNHGRVTVTKSGTCDACLFDFSK